MRFFHKVLVLLSVLALLLIIPGCGNTETDPSSEPPAAPSVEPSITAAAVFSSVSNTMAQSRTTHYRVSVAFSYRYAGSNSADESVIGYELETEILLSNEPFGRSNKAVLTVTQENGQRVLANQQLDVVENGTVITYFQNTSGTWMAEDTGMDPEQYVTTAGSAIYTGEIWPGVGVIDELSADLTPIALSGSQVYTLHGTLPFGQFQTMTEAFGLASDEDLMTQTLPVVWYVDTQTFSIIRAEVDLRTVSDHLQALLTDSLPENARETAKFTLSDLVYELGTGPQTIPELPPKVKETDDSKVLQCGNSYVFVNRPVDWSFSNQTEASLTLKCKAVSANIQYLGGIAEEFFLNKISEQVDYLDNLGLYRSHSTLDPVNGYQVTQILTSGTDYYYAWKTVGEGVVYLEISDYFFDGDAQTLMTLLTGCIAPYTP